MLLGIDIKILYNTRRILSSLICPSYAFAVKPTVELFKNPFVRRNGSAERPSCIGQVNRFLIAPRLPFSNGVEAVLR